MYRTRLKKLHDFVRDQVEDDWFDLGSWTSDANAFQRKECGTTACLMGWAVAAFPDKLCWIGGVIVFKTYSRNYTYFEAGMKLFGLTENQAYFLFGPESYPINCDTPRRSALKRLQWFINEAPNGFVIEQKKAVQFLIPKMEL